MAFPGDRQTGTWDKPGRPKVLAPWWSSCGFTMWSPNTLTIIGEAPTDAFFFFSSTSHIRLCLSECVSNIFHAWLLPARVGSVRTRSLEGVDTDERSLSPIVGLTFVIPGQDPVPDLWRLEPPNSFTGCVSWAAGAFWLILSYLGQGSGVVCLCPKGRGQHTDVCAKSPRTQHHKAIAADLLARD